MTGGEWYRRAFSRHYLDVYSHRDDSSARDEAAFAWNALALRRGARVLDLACGSGRHARALAALGARVAGADLSPDLLAEAARRGAGPVLARADMRALPFPEAFDAVCLFFTSLGYFEDEAEDAQVLVSAARVLRPKGGLLLDLPNRGRVVADLVPESEGLAGDLALRQRRRMTRDGRRVVKDVWLRDASGRLVAEWTESVRLYTPEEIDAMLRGAGLGPEARFGDLSGLAFAPDAPRCVTVARKAR